MSGYEALKKLGILDPRSFVDFDDWYNYLINDYIPNKRPQDVALFVTVSFDPTQYILYRLASEGHLDHKPDFSDAILNKFKEVYGLEIKEEQRIKNETHTREM